MCVVGIIQQDENEIRFSINRDNFFDEMDKIRKVAKKKFGEDYVLFWDGDVMVAKKSKPRKCDLCNKYEAGFEYEDGEKCYRICAFCYIRLNS
jgi:hypothetical protein